MKVQALRIPAYEVQDILADIQHEAAQMGYDGFRHEGGTLTKSKLGKHNVAVLFPDDVKGSGTVYGNRTAGQPPPESGPVPEPKPEVTPQSGRGFANLSGDYLSRMKAKTGSNPTSLKSTICGLR